MQFGLSINDNFDAALDDAVWAETVALDRIAMPDHLLRAQAVEAPWAEHAPAPEPFIQLAALAMATQQIELATLCSPITFRHPAVLLKASIELSIVSRGRFTLGLGTGYRRVEHQRFGVAFPSTHERFLMLEDALGYVSAGRSDRNSGYEGHQVRLEVQELAPSPNRLRLLVGGGGAARTPALAGRYADEYNTFIAEQDAIRERIWVARTAFAENGRRGALAISLAAPLIVGTTPQALREEASRQAVRRGLSTDDYLDQQRQAGTALIGTPEQVAQRLVEFAAIGVNACYFVFDGPVDRSGVLAVRGAFRAAQNPPHPETTVERPRT